MKYNFVKFSQVDKALKFIYIPVIIAAAWFVSTNWYQVSLIHGDSMSPAYHDLQLVLIDRHTDFYTAGDVVAFRCKGLDAVLIKRIAACPGDQVVVQDGTLYVNGSVSSIFPQEGIVEYGGLAADNIFLREDQYFMIGDNLKESKDSRYVEVGVINEENILGKIIPYVAR